MRLTLLVLFPTLLVLATSPALADEGFADKLPIAVVVGPLLNVAGITAGVLNGLEARSGFRPSLALRTFGYLTALANVAVGVWQVHYGVADDIGPAIGLGVVSLCVAAVGLVLTLRGHSLDERERPKVVVAPLVGRDDKLGTYAGVALQVARF